eukprot:12398737-Karenia_brevis.AAC.1
MTDDDHSSWAVRKFKSRSIKYRAPRRRNAEVEQKLKTEETEVHMHESFSLQKFRSQKVEVVEENEPDDEDQ